MPSAIKYIPPTDPKRSMFEVSAGSEAARREQDYALALRYYKGDHEEQLDYDPDVDEVDDNVTINLVRMAADRTVSFLFPKEPTLITDQASVEETEHEKFLRGWLKQSGGMKTLAKWATRGFLAGHTFTQVFDTKPYPRFGVLDPLSVTVFWRADDQADILWYEMRYLVGGVAHIRDFVKTVSDTGETRWEVIDYEKQPKPNQSVEFNEVTLHGRQDTVWQWESWEHTGFVQVKKTTLTVEDSPLQDTPHLPDPDSYYGMGEFKDKGIQDAVNRLSSIRNRIARENASPVDFLAGADAEEIQTGSGLLSHPNEKARPYRMEMKGDLAGITTSIDKLVETFLALVRVVLLKGDAKDLQRVTNASVRTLFLDAIAKNGILQAAYGETLCKMAKYALMLGFKDGRIKENPVNIEITVDWPSPLPIDMTEIANVIALGLAGGYLDKKTAAEEMGHDWQRIKASIEQDRADDLAHQEQVLTMEQRHATIKNEQNISKS